MNTRWSARLEKLPVSIVLFLFFFSVYSFAMAGRIQYGDEIEKYRVAQSIVDRGKFSFRPTAMRNAVGAGGQTYSIYELGQSIVEIPFYVLGKWLNSFAPLPDVNDLGNLLVGLMNPLVTALTGVLVFESCEWLGYTRRTSLALALVFGLATIALPFAKGFTREPLLAFFLLLSFHAVLRFQKSLGYRWLLIAGVALGALVFTKLIQGTAIPILLVYVFVLIFQNEKAAAKNLRHTLSAMTRAGVVLLLPFIVFMGLQGLYALARFGTIYSGIGGTRLNPVNWILLLLPQSQPLTALVGLTVSPLKSVFLYSPPALLFFVAWYKWLRTDAKMAWLFLALVGAAFGTALARPDWDGGTWWGPRYLVQITPFLILPLGILESYRNPARRILGLALSVLFVLGMFVQVVGAFGNARDYLDITGNWITLAGQLDFLRHGAIESLVLYLSPQGFPIQVNPFGVVLAVIAVLLGAWLFRQMRRADTANTGSWRVGLVVGALVLLVEFTAFIAWVVAPYPQVLAAQANTKFVAANAFLADGRTCEASALYRIAIERGTTYQQQAVARLDQLAPLPRGTPVDASALLTQQEKTGSGFLQVDGTTTITGNGSLMASSENGDDVIARGHADPVPVLPNTTYEVFGWIKTANVYGEGFGSVTVSEDDGAYRNIRDTDVAIQDETNGWTRFHKTLTTLPTTHRLFVAAGLWKSFGTVWVDGLQIAQITSDNPALADPKPCN
jgi:Dolichyl-phosphate-mannose-protein mannosyltransferase